MINNDYWNLFAQNGSIDAYLAYKNHDKLTNVSTETNEENHHEEQLDADSHGHNTD